MNNYCYATLLGTDDYIAGVLGLYYSLKKVCAKYPLVVIVPNNIQKNTIQILEKNNILYKKVENNSFSDNISQINYKSTFNKFHCFTLVGYDKVIFLDADIILYKNIDHYFLLNSFSAFRGWAGTITGGIFVIKPNMELAKNIFTNYQHCENDEQILNILFLDEFLKNKSFLLEEDHDILYHRPDDFKYWSRFNLDTSEKIQDFIENDLWVLKLYDIDYHLNHNDNSQNPELKKIYLNYIQEKYKVKF